MIGRIADDTLVPPATPFATPQEYIDDFRTKYAKIENIQDISTDHFRDMVSERADEAILAYMATIPKTFWDNEDFAVDFISIGYIWGSNFIDRFPEAYNHTKVMHHLLSVMDIDLLAEAIKDGDFKKAWSGKIDGVQLVEVAASMLDSFKRPLINDLTAALLLYEAIGDTENLDLSPIARKVEELHPDGFDEIYKIQYATEHMPKCDFTALLEKSVQHHPELFADIAPEKQTMVMAIAAVQHDPGSLADMAAHLFAGKTRPPELTAAFNRLPPESIEREAVADYFTSPEIR